MRNRYLDQTVLSGHQDRPSDLRLFAELGLKALRYPVLWEKVSPERPDRRDFTWSDQRLNEIARLGMRPIVGLCHHGSGPRYTSLVDDQGFAAGLAVHARATAERYPWVRDWTPVNEPLTTARFSALYGIWYPHTRNEGAFWRALLNEIDATRLSMREIRRVNPHARLVQTEDLGFSHATAPMADQAAFENERRWITWDLLCGTVTPAHPLWARIAAWGLADRLRAIADDPCPPDVLGLNHYLSSERLLDHRVELYPEALRGGDGPGPYVNIEAVRTVAGGPLGVGALLDQAWARYGRTIAITECHNGCTREEQMRWFDEVWRAAEAARARGVDLTAVTTWGLLGSYDWNRLLAEEAGFYEAGVFDLGHGRPRPTAMVPLLKALAAGRRPDAPALKGLGWWRRADRFFDQVVELPEPGARPEPPAADVEAARPLLIVGARCARRDALVHACEHRHLAHQILEASASEHEALPARLAERVAEADPWAVVSLAAHAEGDLAAVAAARSLPFASWRMGPPAPPARGPALAIGSDDLITRHDLQAFAGHVLESLRAGERFRAASDRTAPGVYLPDAANAVLDLLIDGCRGAVRLTSPPSLSWAELACYIAREAELDAYLVEPVQTPRIGRAASRPAAAAEGVELVLPGLSSAASRVVATWKLVTAGRNSCPAEAAEDAPAMRHAAE
ncbi:family 1 glycosylhydrolase [Phenylobacterium sp.]|uniref:family 1 glycosylhydrolase n=1 Tax=Phenylobacterium sp. TaxID=1871053 RepID=UPI002CD78AC5|nr:family 1 glycosylhydrolase [Phenylobacterium sp.]HVI33361.1 family 1 glycosylhydrolase [Phenylobacterium sp.]